MLLFLRNNFAIYIVFWLKALSLEDSKIDQSLLSFSSFGVSYPRTMPVYDTHAADLVAPIPDILSRINNLQRRMLPQIEMRVAEQAVQLGEVRRMLGDEHAFTVKARRAMAPDKEMGLAADHDFYGLVSLEEIESAETSTVTVSPVVQRRVDDIEQRLQPNKYTAPFFITSKHQYR